MAASVEVPVRSSGSPRLGRRLLLAPILAALIAAPLWHLHVINRDMPSAHNDLIGRWLGVRAALHGQDPYSDEVTREIQIAYYGRPLTIKDDVPDQAFNYPAQLVVLLAPLASLSWPAFRLVFLLAVVPALALSFYLCVRLLRLPVNSLGAALLATLSLFSWPVIWGLRLQQPTLLAAVFIFVGCFLLSRERYVGAGILLALATIKPQLVLPLLLWLLLWACFRRLWTLLASFVVTAALLLLAAEKLTPGWFPHWLAASRRFSATYGKFPLELVFGHWLGLFATGVLVLWSAYRLWRLRRSAPDSPQFGLAIALVLAATVCANFTILPMIYNQILLVPGCLLLVCLRPTDSYYPGLVRRVVFALLAWQFIAVPLAVVGESLSKAGGFWQGLPFLNILLPVLVAAALILESAEPYAPTLKAPAGLQIEAARS
jgi:hypothetical protein